MHVLIFFLLCYDLIGYILHVVLPCVFIYYLVWILHELHVVSFLHADLERYTDLMVKGVENWILHPF